MISEEMVMYAILVELDVVTLTKVQPSLDATDAYSSIDAVLANSGFNRGKGGLYFGDANATAVTAVIAVSSLAKYPMASAITVMRLLRIEETADLLPAIAVVQPTT